MGKETNQEETEATEEMISHVIEHLKVLAGAEEPLVSDDAYGSLVDGVDAVLKDLKNPAADAEESPSWCMRA